MRRFFLFVLMMGLVAGGQVFPTTADAARRVIDKDLYEELDLFARALHFVREHYVDVPDDEELLHGAIKGMMESLDPHTVFMPPENYQELQSDTQGRFGGVGIEVTVRDKVLTVITPIEGTPASRAGLRAGDKIVKIDGKPTRNLSLAEAVRLMRGKRGSRVKLTLFREEVSKPFHVTLRRDIIRIQSVRGLENLGEGIAYIRISSFQQYTSDNLEKALKELEDDELRGLILDLRNNPGGLLSEAILVADKFLSEGVIVRTRSRTAPPEEKEAKPEGTHPDFPIVILINEGSASAAEIVAGALQDNGRAVLVGMPTFGKGSVQTVYELGEGAAVKLTVARYYTPKGHIIQSKGIKPDIVVKPKKRNVEIKAQEDDEKEMEGKEDDTFTVEIEEDNQKQRAIDYIRKWVATGKKQPFRKYRG